MEDCDLPHKHNTCNFIQYRLNSFGSSIRSVSIVTVTGINYQWYINTEVQTTSYH